MEVMADQEVKPHIKKYEQRQAEAGAAMIAKMSKYVELADSHGSVGGTSLWLYFHDKAKLLDVAKVLKADGFRKLEAFGSPVPEQLSYSLVVNLYHSEHLHEGKLAKIVVDMGINPVEVFDKYDNEFIVTLDEKSDKKKWLIFVELMSKATKLPKDVVVSKAKRSGGEYIELNDRYLVKFRA
jgi:hypothetical protein